MAQLETKGFEGRKYLVTILFWNKRAKHVGIEWLQRKTTYGKARGPGQASRVKPGARGTPGPCFSHGLS